VSAREQCQTGDEGSRKVPARLDEVIETIGQRLDKIEQLKTELAAVKSMLKKCRGCTNQPNSRDCPQCPVNQQRNKIEMLNLIWDQSM